MPAGDGSGPQGRGPLTGRGLGNCSPNVGRNRAFFGRGFRRRNFVYDDSAESLADEKKVLEERIKYINSQLEK